MQFCVAFLRMHNLQKPIGLRSWDTDYLTPELTCTPKLEGVGQKGHVFDLGLLYNLSDGFTNRPVPGVRLFYGYQILKSERWDVVTGLSYVREKPLKIVNIQMLNYATSTSLKLNEKLSFRTQIGYGVALERAASAGAFSQSNNISGALSLGCAYKL